MRLIIGPSILAISCALAVSAAPAGQEAKQPVKKAQPKFAPPKLVKPDEATLKQIVDKTAELRKAVEALKVKKLPDDVFVEVAIYLKAAENIVRFEEWFNASSAKWAIQTLDQGLERAKQAEGGKAVWRDAPGKWVVRAYRSKVDDSIQPYAVLLPHDYAQDLKKKRRLDVVLHGRDGSITEAKFIATHGTTAKEAPKNQEFVQLEVYGRGNNAYRWSGETDVFEAMAAFRGAPATDPIDPNRIVLRGFSMGGAGTWHIGLHHPSLFSVIGPGAGFTTTHGYISNLPKELPEYQEKCLNIYDAYRYAENAFNVPVVAYSGEKDAQKKAADNIENALKSFPEKLRFTHLIAPGLEHQMPAEWQAKAEAEYRKYATDGRGTPARVRFVTYTPRFGLSDWVAIDALERTYDRAEIDATFKNGTFEVRTNNVRRFELLDHPQIGEAASVTIDGTKVPCLQVRTGFEKRDGKWTAVDYNQDAAKLGTKPDKRTGLSGPIDDAFTSRFTVVVGNKEGSFSAATLNAFATLWDHYFRSALPIVKASEYDPKQHGNLVLFGDPQSNPMIAKVLPKLPITWTAEKLIVNGIEYDATTHVPVLIYPNPLDGNKGYVVINSGHTFGEADLKGTNALLYPRLGDWAVLKPTPTDKAPAAYQVVAAGLFDENWQFAKGK